MGGVPVEVFEAALARDPDIEILDRIERTDDGAFYRAAWSVDSPLIDCVRAANGIVLEAQGNVDEWRLKVWFEDRPAASTFQQCCVNRGVPLTIRRLSSVAEYFDTGGVSLSARQQEALVLAYREGYFDEPRGTTQARLAEKLDISSSAVGRRLRRGIATLIEEIV